MSNFGFSELRLVNPYEVAFREARSAVKAQHVLARRPGIRDAGRSGGGLRAGGGHHVAWDRGAGTSLCAVWNWAARLIAQKLADSAGGAAVRIGEIRSLQRRS